MKTAVISTWKMSFDGCNRALDLRNLTVVMKPSLREFPVLRMILHTAPSVMADCLTGMGK